MSELIIRDNGTYIEDPSGELIPVKVHYTRLDAPPSLDADHAVALEREAVAAHLERLADGHDRELTWLAARGRTAEADAQEAESERLRDLAQQIRNGAHHANTPPNAQERGQE